MDWIEAIGLMAGFCTTCSFLPQVLHVLKTRSTGDISLLMYVILCTGVGLWLIYGLFIKSPSIIIANGITFVLAFTILALKIKNERLKS
ncbi:MAG: SemiSWEET family sugar transporter [Candidatus Nucleicultricaceae bacterium]